MLDEITSPKAVIVKFIKRSQRFPQVLSYT